jgi:hypothetical protein
MHKIHNKELNKTCLYAVVHFGTQACLPAGRHEGSLNIIENKQYCEATTELPAGSEFANTFENKY